MIIPYNKIVIIIITTTTVLLLLRLILLFNKAILGALQKLKDPTEGLQYTKTGPYEHKEHTHTHTFLDATDILCMGLWVV